MSKEYIRGKIVSAKAPIGGVILCALIGMVGFSGITTKAETQSKTAPKVLIARGNSGLEWLVSEQLIRRFGERGFSADTVNVRKLRVKKNDLYDVVVVMGGVDRDRVSDRVLEQLTRKSHRSAGERTRFLITTVHGDLWAEGKTIIDAVSKATDDADAENIAKKIAALVENALERDSD